MSFGTILAQSEHFKVSYHRHGPMKTERTETGFSMVELLVVLAVVAILLAIILPNMGRVIVSYRLDSSGRAVASLMQQTRFQAVKTNQAYYLRFDNTLTPNVAFMKQDPVAGGYVQGDPAITLPSGYTFQTTVTADFHKQLDDFLGNSVAIELATPVGFNPRGMPCVNNPVGSSVCAQVDPVLPGAPGFEWFFQGTNPNAWEAITVTPGGRTKAWRMISTGAACGPNGAYTTCWN